MLIVDIVGLYYKNIINKNNMHLYNGQQLDSHYADGKY